MRKRVHVEPEFEDLPSQAGWMYADLFLALVVIFLATISFVPDISAFKSGQGSGRAASTTVKTNSAFNFDEGLTLITSKNEINTLPGVINQFLKKNKYPTNSEIIYVQVVGGYNAATEPADKGALRALSYSLDLNKSAPKLFARASTSLDSSSSISADQVAVRLTFAAKIGK